MDQQRGVRRIGHGHIPPMRPVRSAHDRVRAALGFVGLSAVYGIGWLVLWVLVPVLLLSLDTTVIASDSMRPALRSGDVVLLRPYAGEPLPDGAVVTFAAPGDGRLVTHRVIGTNGDGSVITRGDASTGPDPFPVTPERIRGVATILVPGVGLVAVWRADLGLPWIPASDATFAGRTDAAAALATTVIAAATELTVDHVCRTGVLWPRLDWTPSPDAAVQHVLRDGEPIAVLRADVTTFVDETASLDATHRYVVRTLHDSGWWTDAGTVAAGPVRGCGGPGRGAGGA